MQLHSFLSFSTRYSRVVQLAVVQLAVVQLAVVQLAVVQLAVVQLAVVPSDPQDSRQYGPRRRFG
jgi:hypothetical protein